MSQRAVDFGKITAMSVVSAGLAFFSTHVKAEDAAQQVAAVEMPRPRVAAPAVTVGGLKPGQRMVIEGGAAETMSAAAYAQRPVMTPALKSAEAWCIVK